MKNNMLQSSKQRESNFELLRILACLMVVAHHFIEKGNGILLDQSFSLQQFVYMLLLPGGKIGVNCFLLLSGYFLSQKPAGTDRVLRLVWTVTLYSVAGSVLAVLVGQGSSISSWKAAVLPIAYNTVGWFVAPFLVLTSLSRFINQILDHLDQAEFLRLLVCLTGICMFCPNVLPHSSFFIDQFVWFVYVYVIGAYLRRYPAAWMENRRKVLGLTAASLAANTLVQVVLRLLFHTKPDKLALANYYAISGNSVLCLVSAVLLFLLCRTLSFRNRIVNWVAGGCFGVYLLSDCTILGVLLWEKIGALSLWQRSTAQFLGGTVASVLAVFGICLVAAKLLYYGLERPLFGLWRKLDALWERSINGVIGRILSKKGGL